MKLSARDIPGFLKSPAQVQGVLIYGPDGGAVRERAQAVAAQILGPKPDPLNRLELSAETLKADAARLHDELSALSLMGGPRVVILRDIGEKMAPLIAEALEGLTPTAYLIVEEGELAASSSLRKLFEGSVMLAALPCYREEGRNLEETIRGTLSGLGLRVAPDALRYLSEQLGNDRGVTQSELLKIALYLGEEKDVTLPVAMALTDHNASETIEDLCYAVGEGNGAELQSLLHRLLHEGVQPVVILRALLRHFQRLEKALAQMESGMGAEQAVSAMRPPVFFKYVPRLRRELNAWKKNRVAQALGLLLRTEKEVKSSLASPALLTSQALLQAARLAA